MTTTLLSTDRRRPVRADRRGVARHARILRSAHAITKRLIAEKGFTAVAVEADWPDAYRVNRYVRGSRRTTPTPTRRSADSSASRPGCGATPSCAISSTGCARTTPACRAARRRPASTGSTSTASTPRWRQWSAIWTGWIRRPRGRARDRYGCLEHFGEDSQRYGYAASFDLSASCEEASHRATRRTAAPGRCLRASRRPRGGGRVLLRRAERPAGEERRGVLPHDVPRATSRRGTCATAIWPRRWTRCVAHLDRHGGRTKIVVWAHNSHLGDARATQMGDDGRVERRATRARAARRPRRC